MPQASRGISPVRTLTAIQARKQGGTPVKVVLAYVPGVSFSPYPPPDPLGIEVLAGQLRQEGSCDVTLTRVTDDMKILTEEIITGRPEILGLSLPVGSASPRFLGALMEQLNQHQGISPYFLMFGNVSATFAYRQLLGLYPQALAVLYEGEPAMRSLIQIVANGGKLEQLPNAAYFDQEKTLVTPRQIERSSLENSCLPYRPHLAKQLLAGTSIHLESSRGCDWNKCTFCSGGGTRESRGIGRSAKPVEVVADEIETLDRQGVRSAVFCDPDFIGNDGESVSILAEEITRREIDMNFLASVRVKSVIDHNVPKEINNKRIITLKKMRRAGIKDVCVGVEAGNFDQLRRYCKGTTTSEIMEAIRTLKRLDFNVFVAWLPVDPLMTLDELQENLRFFKRIMAEGCVVLHVYRRFRVQEGSPYVGMLRGKGLLAGDYDIGTLSWPYHFLDRRVEAVVNQFEAWEALDGDLAAYLIRFTKQGELLHGYAVAAYDLRSRALELLVNLIKHNVEPNNNDEWKKTREERRASFQKMQEVVLRSKSSMTEELIKLIAETEIKLKEEKNA